MTLVYFAVENFEQGSGEKTFAIRTVIGTPAGKS